MKLLGDRTAPIYTPDMIDSLTGRTFYIIDPDAYLPEPAAHLALLFSFGMLARYFRMSGCR